VTNVAALVQQYKTGDAANKEVALGQLTEHAATEFKAQQTPPGGIPGLCPLLEARRFTHGIPNGAFKTQAAFDVCFVHQVSRFETETYGTTKIVMPKTAKKRVDEETPRGVLVSAGLQALDHLRSNGIDLGHMVSLIRMAPWRMPIDNVLGAEQYVLILRTGDITGSEDLREALAAGKCRIEFNKETRQHIYVDEQGQPWTPTVPFLPEDY
jgi:hypothetical protein